MLFLDQQTTNVNKNIIPALFPKNNNSVSGCFTALGHRLQYFRFPSFAFSGQRSVYAISSICDAFCVMRPIDGTYRWTDGQTDGRTPYRYIDTVAYYASSVSIAFLTHLLKI